jgi:hypothetical protein
MDTACPVVWCTAATHSEGHSGDHLELAVNGGTICVWPVQQQGEPPRWVLGLAGARGEAADAVELDAEQLEHLAGILAEVAPPRP